ncbi:hypothetical protein PAHAL_5G367100 [Panicum hallii]|uniref:Uncharacterized protein n=1 Tax=Panicum hallii TaxID=206008 RepID=A0A2T8IME1_9POAL|nr:hypothetical protein PAHAL_5G367100 [Panicum hallii]
MKLKDVILVLSFFGTMNSPIVKEPTPQAPKPKVSSPEECPSKFIKVINKLTDEQKKVISDIGFSALLHLSSLMFSCS